jgi:flagellar basal-body rod protein FlgG
MIEKKNILVLEPENVDKLVKEGNSLFRPDESSELKALTQTNSVRQGFVEKSNVNPITEMVAMIETNRLVGMYQKAMDTQMNDLNRDAIEKIAVSR